MLQRFFEHSYFTDAPRAENRVASLTSYYRESDPETLAHASAIAAWGEGVLGSFSAETLYERVRSLKDAAAELPKIGLYVPVRFDAPHIERIGLWCRAHIAPDIMIECTVNPATVGGCAFAYRSAYHDRSLLHYAKKERRAVAELIRTYA